MFRQSVISTALSLILIGLFASRVHAISGTATTVGADAESCRILNWENSDRQVLHSMCSGRLISPSEVLTAGHCIDRGSYIEVSCGFSGVDARQTKMVLTKRRSPVDVGGPQFLFQALALQVATVPGYSEEDPLQRVNDIALLKLDHNWAGHREPSPIQNASALNDFPQPANCQLSGFGRVGGVSGAPHSGQFAVNFFAAEQFVSVSGRVPKTDEAQRIVYKVTVGDPSGMNIFNGFDRLAEILALPAWVNAGDSGSVLICQDNSQNFAVVGVTSLLVITQFEDGSTRLVEAWAHVDEDRVSLLRKQFQ